MALILKRTCGASLARRGAAAAAPALRPGVVRRFKPDEAPEAPVAAPAAPTTKVAFTLPHRVEFGHEIAVIGAPESLGGWDTTEALALSWTEGDVWVAEAEVPVGSEVEYKYIIRAPDTLDILEWQPVEGNLTITVDGAAGPTLVKDNWEGAAHELLTGPEAAAATPAIPPPAPAAPAEEAPAPEAPIVEAALEAEAAVEESEVAPAPVAAEAEAAFVEEEAAPVAEPAPEAPAVDAAAPKAKRGPKRRSS